MWNSNLSESELLKSLLEPLLDDFQYWFSGAHSLLTTEVITSLGTDEQADLLARVTQAQQEVAAARALFQVTNGQVGIEASALLPWHQLVSECWKVSAQYRSGQSKGNTQTDMGIE
jgi:Protein of unknown function (DUF2605)